MKEYVALLALLLLIGCSMPEETVNTNPGKDGQGKNGGGQQLHEDDHIASLPFEDISDSEIQALDMAMDDEFKARATYEKVLEQFGDLKPFSNIISAEQNHIDELKQLYEKYELQVPKDNWTGNIADIDSVIVACETGVQAEIDNAALYDELFEMVNNQDIIEVFTSLQSASQNNHLPAFEKCVARES